jgi:O-antigen/teichoic acid export membrane protein
MKRSAMETTRQPDDLSAEESALATRAAWLVLGKTAAFVLAFAMPLLLVRLLTVKDFGLYKQLFLIVNTAVVVLPLGFATSAYYFWSRLPGRQGAIVLNVLVFHLLTTGTVGLVLWLQPQLLAAIFHGPELAAHGRAIGLLVLLWGTSALLETVAIANGEARFAAGLIAFLQFTKVVFLLGAVLFQPTLAALVRAAILQGVLQMALMLAYVSMRFAGIWRGLDLGLLRSQLAYALPLGLGAWLYWIQMEAHHYVIANRFYAATYAVYAVGCFQLPLLGILSESVGSVAIPQVSRLQKEGRTHDIVRLVAGLTRRLAALYLPLFAFLLVVRREFISVLFTERYQDAVPIFAINLAVLPLAAALNGADAVIRAWAESRFFMLKLRLVLATLTLPCLWLATERFGLLGAATVVVSASFLDRTAMAIKAARILGLARHQLGVFSDLPKLAFAAAAGGFATWLAKAPLLELGPLAGLAVGAVCCALVFLTMALASGAVRLPDLLARRSAESM